MEGSSLRAALGSNLGMYLGSYVEPYLSFLQNISNRSSRYQPQT